MAAETTVARLMNILSLISFAEGKELEGMAKERKCARWESEISERWSARLFQTRNT